MDVFSLIFRSALLFAMFFVFPSYVFAETAELEMKFVGDEDALPEEMYSICSFDSFYESDLDSSDGAYGGEEKPPFTEVITSDRGDYRSQTPFRGVAKMGDCFIGFAVDGQDEGTITATAYEYLNEDGEIVPEEEEVELKAPAFDRLYFDINRNGDLTDEEPVEANEFYALSSDSICSYFPRIDLEIETDGVSYPYAFYFDIRSSSENMTFSDWSGDENSPPKISAWAEIRSAAYREGTINLNGESLRVVLVDFNANGRFDDDASIIDSDEFYSRPFYVNVGDALLIDPGPFTKIHPAWIEGNLGQHCVGPWTQFDGQLYETTISPDGTSLTLTPLTSDVGWLTKPNAQGRAILYGDQGVIEIEIDGTKPTPLPPGEWCVFGYCFDTPGAEPEAVELVPYMAHCYKEHHATVAYASEIRSLSPLAVGSGETVIAEFGPPCQASVEMRSGPEDGVVTLSMELLGAGMEECEILIEGDLPPSPRFAITTLEGVEVATGDFEFGKATWRVPEPCDDEYRLTVEIDIGPFEVKRENSRILQFRLLEQDAPRQNSNVIGFSDIIPPLPDFKFPEEEQQSTNADEEKGASWLNPFQLDSP
jgi:hypothetical protein